MSQAGSSSHTGSMGMTPGRAAPVTGGSEGRGLVKTPKTEKCATGENSVRCSVSMPVGRRSQTPDSRS